MEARRAEHFARTIWNKWSSAVRSAEHISRCAVAFRELTEARLARRCFVTWAFRSSRDAKLRRLVQILDGSMRRCIGHDEWMTRTSRNPTVRSMFCRFASAFDRRRTELANADRVPLARNGAMDTVLALIWSRQQLSVAMGRLRGYPQPWTLGSWVSPEGLVLIERSSPYYRQAELRMEAMLVRLEEAQSLSATMMFFNAALEGGVGDCSGDSQPGLVQRTLMWRALADLMVVYHPGWPSHGRPLMPFPPELESRPSWAQRERHDSESTIERPRWRHERSDNESAISPALQNVHVTARQPTPIEVQMAPVEAVRVLTTVRIPHSCPSPDSSYSSSPRSSGIFPAARPKPTDVLPIVIGGPQPELGRIPAKGAASSCVSGAPPPRPGYASPAGSGTFPADFIPRPHTAPGSAVFVQRIHPSPRAPQVATGPWIGAARPAPGGAPPAASRSQGSPAASSAMGSPCVRLTSPPHPSSPMHGSGQGPRLELDSMPEGQMEIQLERPGSATQSPDWSERTCSPHFGARQTIGGVEEAIAGVLAN